MHHPLFGERLGVEGWRRINGVVQLIVRLPDGSPATVELGHTSAGVPAEHEATATVLSVDGIRRLRALVQARLSGGACIHT